MPKDIKFANNSFLSPIELRITKKLCKLVPISVGTKALTFLSLGSSLLILSSYILAGKILISLFAASFFIIMQWIFDCLDGEIGRSRKEGFVRWGFYMDHLFDYFFMASIVFGFWFLFPGLKLQILILFFLFTSFMVNFFLFYSTMKDKEPGLAVSFGRFSPIEFRLLVILFNTLLYFFEGNVRHFVDTYLSYFNIILFMMLIIVVYSCQKTLNKHDVSDRN